jgi:hydrogenase maturation protease
MGAGNILMGDDGIGVHIICALKEQGGLPDGIELIDAGTATLDALPLLDGVERLIIIDAVIGGGPPGAIYQFSPDDIHENTSGRVSLHQTSLLQALRMGGILGSGSVEVVVFGIEPGDVSPGTELTPDVRAIIPKVVETITNLINQ